MLLLRQEWSILFNLDIKDKIIKQHHHSEKMKYSKPRGGRRGWVELIEWHWNIYAAAAAAAAKLLQSCPTLWDPIDGSPPGYPIPGILQARTSEWVAISFSNEWKWKVKVKSFSHVQFLATPWTAAHQTPLSMGFARQEYWSGVPLPSLNIYATIC